MLEPMLGSELNLVTKPLFDPTLNLVMKPVHNLMNEAMISSVPGVRESLPVTHSWPVPDPLNIEYQIQSKGEVIADDSELRSKLKQVILFLILYWKGNQLETVNPLRPQVLIIL